MENVVVNSIRTGRKQNTIELIKRNTPRQQAFYSVLSASINLIKRNSRANFSRFCCSLGGRRCQDDGGTLAEGPDSGGTVAQAPAPSADASAATWSDSMLRRYVDLTAPRSPSLASDQETGGGNC